MGVYIPNISMPTCEEECEFYEMAPFRPYPYCTIYTNCHGINNCPLKPKTRMDKVRVMSDEDFAKFIETIHTNGLKGRHPNSTWLEWLQKERPIWITK